MSQNRCSGIIFQSGFNDLTRMDGDAVNRPEEQCVVGYQTVLIVEPQNGEGFAVKRGKLQA
jgi:hypothetical protein